MTTTMRNGNWPLVAPTRNNYFYGQLLSEDEFRKQADYFIDKLRLINRLALGSGVLCGLDVVPEVTDEGRMVAIQPGVAIDDAGNMIVVPDSPLVDPHQLTDDQGNPTGDPLTEGEVAICLAYVECLVDPVPVLIPECDTPDNCAPGTVREGYCLVVRPAEDPPTAPPGCSLDEFPLPANEALHELLCEQLSRGCPEPGSDPCVTLARVTLQPNEVTIARCAGRSLVYNNTLIYELILCLAERVNGLAQGLILRYVGGDGQSGPPDERLARQLEVAVVDGEGQGVQDVLVEFSGDGQQEPRTRRTNAEGIARTRWTLASEPGRQQVTARAAGSSLRVVFSASAIDE